MEYQDIGQSSPYKLIILLLTAVCMCISEIGDTPGHPPTSALEVSLRAHTYICNLHVKGEYTCVISHNTTYHTKTTIMASKCPVQDGGKH